MDLRLFGVGMVTFKMGPAFLLPASMAIPGMVVGKGGDRGMGTWSGHLSPLQTKPGSIFYVSLEHGPLLLREAVQWGWFLNGTSCTRKCCLFVAIRTRLAMAEPRESCLCGGAAWSTQG